MKKFDNQFLSEEIRLIAGVDEAGRGPLAGPVVAAAVIFEPDSYIADVNDSKKISESKREILFPQIINQALTFGIAAVTEVTIDKINILNASLLAMKQAVGKLKIKPDLILVDGNRSFSEDENIKTIVGGDAKSLVIAAASILAKVTRDRIMRDLSEFYPDYNLEKNKGYPTKLHREVLMKIGPSPIHRKTFIKNII